MMSDIKGGGDGTMVNGPAQNCVVDKTSQLADRGQQKRDARHCGTRAWFSVKALRRCKPPMEKQIR